MTYIPPNPNGQGTMANSAPVVVASNQSAIPVSGTFWQSIQPVSFTWTGLTDTQLRATAVVVSMTSTTITGSVAVMGPLTDAQLRAAVVPVSLASTTITGSVAVTGSFWQATQPISANSLPLPAGAATEATLSALSAKTPALGQAVAASSSPVVVASNQTAIPVSGTFWQATQPVSFSWAGLTDAQLRAAVVPVSLASTTITGAVTITGSVTGSGTFTCGGVAAHSAASSGNPVQIGGVVSTAVSINEVAGDVCRVAMTTGGAQVVKPYSVPEVDWAYASAAGGIITITDVVIKAAAGASIRNYITAISFTNASAVTATEVVVKDGATIIWRGFVGAQTLLNSVVGVVFPTPLRGSANTAINVACITAGAAVYVNAQGYIAP